MFLQKTLYTPPIFQNKRFCSPSQKLLEDPLFNIFLLVYIVDVVYNISNKYQPSSNLAKY